MQETGWVSMIGLRQWLTAAMDQALASRKLAGFSPVVRLNAALNAVSGHVTHLLGHRRDRTTAGL